MGKFKEDGHLAVLAKEIIDASTELRDAQTVQWRIIFTESSLGHDEIAGKCKRVDSAIRYLWGTDFIILIQKEKFDASTALEKTRILVHELHHIEAEDGEEPTIRHHRGDFCSIPEHDKFSYRVAESIYRKLKNLQAFTTQEEIKA